VEFVSGRHHTLWQWWSVAWRLRDLSVRGGRFYFNDVIGGDEMVLRW
jgi:hypothetical protein